MRRMGVSKDEAPTLRQRTSLVLRVSLAWRAAFPRLLAALALQRVDALAHLGADQRKQVLGRGSLARRSRVRKAGCVAEEVLQLGVRKLWQARGKWLHGSRPRTFSARGKFAPPGRS